jgi:Endonuclease NucS
MSYKPQSPYVPLNSEQKAEVLQHIDSGLSTNQIAELMDIYPMQVAGVKAARARGSYQGPAPAETITVDDALETTFGLERDLQVALRHNIHQLDANLTIIDGGKERTVASGRTDILAHDRVGRVVLELKAGVADTGVIGQVLAYVGDLQAEDPAEPVRGVVIAHDFTPRAVSAARAGNVQLMRYGHSFTFRASN